MYSLELALALTLKQPGAENHVKYLLPILIFLGTIPAPKSGYVHDFANLLPPEVESQLENLGRLAERETTAKIAVVTVASLEAATVDEYAHRLFNTWGIGWRSVNNGVLFLIAPNERRMRIEVGYGLEPLLTDSLCGEIRDLQVIPHFKANRYVEGIVAGTEEIVRILRAHPEAARGIKASAPLFVDTPYRTSLLLLAAAIACSILWALVGKLTALHRDYSSVLLLFAACILVGLTAYAIYHSLSLPKPQQSLAGIIVSIACAFVTLLYNWRKYWRFGPHGCPKCGGSMMLLDEAKDDERLNAVQQLEEQLGSVDYDVWFCPACLATDTDSYVKWFSGFSPCPKCRHRTFSEMRTVTLEPTQLQTGTARYAGHCASCRHSQTHEEIIPRVSSSSGSSFGGGGGGGSGGGGSSGGGGASGGW
jgi:uncharacterized protein